ncbi:MAG: hypothetical protein M1837_002771 [Sclerophora amabilis]|nr:MAG: hypothetical protein M1837_002771 [Sclerophora amabilis]
MLGRFILFLSLLATVGPTHAVFGGRKLGSNHWAQVHDKIHVLKRDSTKCSEGLYLCENGGCCPEGKDCGITDCPAKSAVAATAACSQSGYTPCDIQDGGGCCPHNFACARNDCIPPAGFTATTNNCEAGSRVCGAEFGYGCCRSDLDCGLSTCYPRTTSSFVATLTVITTDARSSTITKVKVVTTAYIPSRSTLPITSRPVVPEKHASSEASSTAAVPKLAPIPTSLPQPSGSLSDGAIGGLVIGIVACLVAVLVISLFLIRRLKPDARRSESSPSARSQCSGAAPPMRQPRRPGHFRADSGSETLISPGTTAYTPVPSSDQSGSLRTGSVDTSAQMQEYFSPRCQDQNLWYGHDVSVRSQSPSVVGSPRVHHRTLSDDSVTTNNSLQGIGSEARPSRRDTQDSMISELEAPEGPSTSQRSFPFFFGSRRPSLTSSRRSSEGQDGSRARGLSLTPRLENVIEADVSQVDLSNSTS